MAAKKIKTVSQKKIQLIFNRKFITLATGKVAQGKGGML
jgi:hypothetical protein